MTKGAQGSISLDARRFLQGQRFPAESRMKNEQLTFAPQF